MTIRRGAFTLLDFVRESNRIEGILREPTEAEIDAHERLLALEKLSVADIEEFVRVIAPGKPLRNRVGMNVRVGRHVAPPGGPNIQTELESILGWTNKKESPPAVVHQFYEQVHPFMDGNGRSGRALWLWMMGGIEHAPLGFLRPWYYQSLSEGRS